MHLRRALLLFALVLGMTAIAASIAPPPAEDPAGSGDEAAPPAAPGDDGPQFAEFRFPPDRKRPTVRRVEPDRPLVVSVAADAPGQAAIPLLGRVSSLTPNDPARFDLLAPESGSYDVQFTPTAGGEARRIGTIRVRSER